MKINKLLLILLLIFAAVGTASVSASFKWRSEKNDVFNIGEKIVYAVKWQFVSVGTAHMLVSDSEQVGGRECYHITTKAESAPFFDSVFRVRDTNESWIDKQSLCSLKYTSSLSEGNYKSTETLLFDQPTRTFTIPETGKSGATLSWVQDVLSSLYFLRTREIAIGKVYKINAHSGDKSWKLNVKVTGKEKVLLPMGQFTCFVVEPTIREDAGIFRSTGELKVWLTADSKKLPIKMSSKIIIGSITAEAVEINP